MVSTTSHPRGPNPLRLSRHRVLAVLATGLLMGIVVVLLVQQIARAQLEAVFDARLADHGVNVNDEVLDLEREHLALLRGIVFTEGFAAALEQRDLAAMQAIITTLQANSDVPMVDIVDETGTVIMAVRGEGAPPPVATRAGWPVVQKALAGERDELGERHAALVIASEGALLVTASPIESVRGAVVVATPLADIIARASSSIALTVYSADGDPIVTTLDDAPPRMMPELARRIVEGDAVPATRHGATRSATYRELLGRLVVRGQGSAVLGVGLPDTISSMAFQITLAVALGWAVMLIIVSLLSRRGDGSRV